MKKKNRGMEGSRKKNTFCKKFFFVILYSAFHSYPILETGLSLHAPCVCHAKRTPRIMKPGRLEASCKTPYS